jgi:hypothetical protein
VSLGIFILFFACFISLQTQLLRKLIVSFIAKCSHSKLSGAALSDTSQPNWLLTGVKLAGKVFFYCKNSRNLLLVMIGCTLGYCESGVIPTILQRFLSSDIVSDILRSFGSAGETTTGGFSLYS